MILFLLAILSDDENIDRLHFKTDNDPNPEENFRSRGHKKGEFNTVFSERFVALCHSRFLQLIFMVANSFQREVELVVVMDGNHFLEIRML
jgi:hypothetical protein